VGAPNSRRRVPEDPDQPAPSPEHIAQQRLERENARLQQRLHNVEQALKIAVRTLSPYAANAQR
jgi:hypothetical protein